MKCVVSSRAMLQATSRGTCASVVIATCTVSALPVPAGSVAAHRTLPVGRVVVYARVVVCEDYLTNTLINTQRGVSPSSLARGTRSESQTHPSRSRERTHTDPMCRARPALPQARNDPSCAPCAYARKHMRLLTSYSSTLRHTPPEDSASGVHRGGGAAARAQVGEAVNDPLYEAWNCRQRCGLRAKVSRLEGGRAVGRVRGAGDPPLERRLLSDILTCVFDLR